MFAIAFDMTVAAMQKHHPRGVRAGYEDIGSTLSRFDFRWIQGASICVRTKTWQTSPMQ